MNRESGNLDGLKSKERLDEKIGFQENGSDFLEGKSADKIKLIGFEEKAQRNGNSGFQELTLSYLCENSKPSFPEEDLLAQNLLNSLEKFSCSSSYKGKGIVVPEVIRKEDNNKWLERDVLQLNENKENSFKREGGKVETWGENREKKHKVESLDLSLALPDVSLFLNGSNHWELPSMLRPSTSVQSVGRSFNNAQSMYSLSYSHSHPMSHNPSCSLTMNSTENYDYSVGSHCRECDQNWNHGEGTNGSVHSRFRPIGDGTVASTDHCDGGAFGVGNRGDFNKDSCNSSLYMTTSSENLSFFPSELPARPRMEGQSGDTRGRGLGSLRDSEDFDIRKPSRLSTPERILREIVSESVPVMAQIIQELTAETVESTKAYLKNVIANPEMKNGLVVLQKRLERRSDLTNETLSKCQKSQLEMLVAIKTGHGSFLTGKNCLPTADLVDIFLLEKCRNINCRRLLPVDDCECKICSSQKGFCSECMCSVCFKFDCASNTCSWVGCDACSHWCHTSCGLKRNIIKTGLSFKGRSGMTEMQFHCFGCGHASEMFGFIKDVFMSCAKNWSQDTMIKELDCVTKIFRGSDDRKGKEIHVKANEMLTKLENKIIAPLDVCNLIFRFFHYADGLLDLDDSSLPWKDLTNQLSFQKATSFLPLSNSQSTKTPLDNTSIMKYSIEDEWSVKPSKKYGFHSLERLISIKAAEARMFQDRAEEARREVESFRQMVRMRIENFEIEFTEKIAKFCLPETEERQRKKAEELKELENLQYDYHKMEKRMQSEISGLLNRMKATKLQILN